METIQTDDLVVPVVLEQDQIEPMHKVEVVVKILLMVTVIRVMFIHIGMQMPVVLVHQVDH